MKHGVGSPFSTASQAAAARRIGLEAAAIDRSQRSAPLPSVRWLDDCSRRLRELHASMTGYEADQAAVRLWHRSGARGEVHPVAAAEQWQAPDGQDGFSPQPAQETRQTLR